MKKWLGLVLLPLLLGALAYWTTRGGAPPLFLDWLEVPPAPIDLLPWLPEVLKNSLPSACWTFSLTAALLLIWKPEDRKGTFRLGSIAAGIAVIFEVLQLMGTFPGTFDWWDVGFSALASFLAVLIFRKLNP